MYVHTPLITGSDCEGAGEMFQVTTLDLNNLPMTDDGKVDFSKDFFNKPTNLTVSGPVSYTHLISHGIIYTRPGSGKSFDDYLVSADTKMYQLKPVSYTHLQSPLRLESQMAALHPE